MDGNKGQYDILVVDNDPERRIRMKYATSAAKSIFGHIAVASELNKGLDSLKSLHSRVVIFVGDSFSGPRVGTFIEQAKSARAGLDSAYVLQAASTRTSPVEVYANVLQGLDAVLKEPFSVDELVDTTHAAAQIFYKRRAEREGKAIAALVSRTLDALDKIATSKAIGDSPGELIQELHQSKTVIAALSDDLKATYYHELGIQAAAAKVPLELTRYLESKVDYEQRVFERARQKVSSLDLLQSGSRVITKH